MNVKVIFKIGCNCLKRKFTVKIVHGDRRKCPSYGGVCLTIVRFIEVFLWETHLHSAGTCRSVRLREVSVLWDVHLKGFHCIWKRGLILPGYLFHDWWRSFRRERSCSFLCNAPVKSFYPNPPRQPRGQRKNLCDKKGRGTGKWSEKRAGHWKVKGLKWLIRAGQVRN